ncbi:hypothetical protein ACEN2J_19660 [Pseudorhodobacter sp. W20_MBD10_FR17]|uniref:hypothetical protein n=1 Tax=Pseudorhodobacter sp. W20_MBD10_FR17 TaxID=3240266 RepID=UPI003F9C4080
MHEAGHAIAAHALGLGAVQEMSIANGGGHILMTTVASDAGIAAYKFDGGSMAPLVYASELETLTVSRTGELKRMLEEMRERYGD